MGEAHLGGRRSSQPHLTVGVDHTVPGVQYAGPAAHLLPALDRFLIARRLAEDLPVEGKDGVAADDDGALLTRRHRDRLELGQLERVVGGRRHLDGGLVDSADHDLG